MDGNLLTFLQHNRNLHYVMFLNKLKKQIYIPIGNLDAKVLKSKEPIPYKEALQSHFEDTAIGESWGGFFDCAWFKFSYDKKINNPNDLVVLLDVGAEGCVYNTNGVVQGITNVIGMVDFFQTTRGKQVVPLERITTDFKNKLEFYVDCGNNGRMGKSNGDAKLKKAQICRFRQDILDLYYDVLACYQLLCAIKGNDKIHKIKSVINSAIRNYKDDSPESVSSTRKILSELLDEKDKKDFTVYAVGHGHLDLAWLWPVRETKRKAIRTFSNAIYQGEKCPQYVFNGSQPQQYKWIKENSPELFEKIKVASKNGNIEVQGGMWVEPDTNLPCGESLIRQCYYGKSFFKNEFGKDVRTLWLPDVFGYTAALPQIIKKCGMDNFMTIKLSWNNINDFPHHTFLWQGLDDSTVLVHMPPEGDYNSNATPYAFQKTSNNYKEKEISNVALMSYGIGDGGAGPGEYHVEMAKRCEKLRYIPKVKMASSDEFFEELQKGVDTFPQYKGELYLEKHQGTYTTQALVKKNNRKCESLLHFAEWIASIGALKGKAYPTEELDKIWKEVLLYQFHDILPGSSINRVYKECNARYEIIKDKLNSIIDDTIAYLTNDENELTAINPTAFSRKGYTKYENKWYSYDLQPYSSAKLEKAKEDENLSYSQNSIENDLLKIVFNDNGQIVECIDKASNYNCVKSVFSAPRIYKDKYLSPYNAWDIDIKYTKHKPTDMKLINTKTHKDGKCIIRENYYEYGKSSLTQTIILEDNSPYIKVKNHVSWHETHKMLRVDFYPKNYGDEVLCDIQFGNLKRSTKTDNKVDYAQFEIPAHKWVDIYDDGYGVAIINDCKYGHRVKDGLISLNCLRSPIYPDKTADRGEHDFTYAIYPHKEKPMESELSKIGYEINNPIKICDKQLNIDSICKINKSNIILETILTNEKGNICLRLYENSGVETDTKFNINTPYTSVFETNMLYENKIEILTDELHFKPFEIKTLEVIV